MISSALKFDSCYLAFIKGHFNLLCCCPLSCRNPKLASIPSLSNDLQMIFKLGHKIECGDPSKVLPKEGEEIHSDVGHLTQRAQHVPVLDLNSLPCSGSDNEENNQNAAG
mgnify:CR=1 FL=1